MVNLTSLSMRNSILSDENLKVLSTLTWLTELDISSDSTNTDYSNIGLYFLSSLVNITKLNLSSS